MLDIPVQAKDAAEASNRAKSTFLATMSHELRTPLNGIRGMMHLAAHRATDPKQADWQGKSQGAAQHLLSVIKDILDLSRIDADRVDQEVEDFTVHHVVDETLQMQGDAGVESEYGTGSSFWATVRLQRAIAAVAAPDRSPMGPSSIRLPEQFRGMRVLVVDDEPIGLEIATSTLDAMGLTVDQANDGRQAIERVRTCDYALVLMDMQMPVLSGIDATRAIRALPKASALPIVAVTANALDDDREACLAAGMNDHLGKPVSPAGAARDGTEVARSHVLGPLTVDVTAFQPSRRVLGGNRGRASKASLETLARACGEHLAEPHIVAAMQRRIPQPASSARTAWSSMKWTMSLTTETSRRLQCLQQAGVVRITTVVGYVHRPNSLSNVDWPRHRG